LLRDSKFRSHHRFPWFPVELPMSDFHCASALIFLYIPVYFHILSKVVLRFTVSAGFTSNLETAFASVRARERMISNLKVYKPPPSSTFESCAPFHCLGWVYLIAVQCLIADQPFLNLAILFLGVNMNCWMFIQPLFALTRLDLPWIIIVIPSLFRWQHLRTAGYPCSPRNPA